MTGVGPGADPGSNPLVITGGFYHEPAGYGLRWGKRVVSHVLQTPALLRAAGDTGFVIRTHDGQATLRLWIDFDPAAIPMLIPSRRAGYLITAPWPFRR